MEFLEVLRRWMWIFFRVETEWGKLDCPPERVTTTDFQVVRNNRGPAPDDILLGDFNGRIDED
jgi:EXS family